MNMMSLHRAAVMSVSIDISSHARGKSWTASNHRILPNSSILGWTLGDIKSDESSATIRAVAFETLKTLGDLRKKI